MHVARRPGHLLVVGESPGSNPSELPLSARCPTWTGRRLARILDLDWRVYEGSVSRMNMSDVPGAPPVQFDDQPIGPGEWDERFWEIKRLSKTRAVVLLGKSVADSVLLRPLDVEWDWFFPIPLEAPFGGGLVLEAVVVPHPSGNSRVYNDPEMRRAAHDAVWTAISRLSS